jgi:hypothetical protein
MGSLPPASSGPRWQPLDSKQRALSDYTLGNGAKPVTSIDYRVTSQKQTSLLNVNAYYLGILHYKKGCPIARQLRSSQPPEQLFFQEPGNHAKTWR